LLKLISAQRALVAIAKFSPGAATIRNKLWLSGRRVQ